MMVSQALTKKGGKPRFKHAIEEVIPFSIDMTESDYSIFKNLSTLIISEDFIFNTTKLERKKRILNIISEL